MSKIEKEKRVVASMVGLYCRRIHRGGGKRLCPECASLLEYALGRLSRCPHGEGKPTCRRCNVHCYSHSRRKEIAAVMRYSGPRMLFYHPLTALRHLLD